MAVSLYHVKKFLRVDFDEDDEMIEGFISSAEGHFKSIGVDIDANPLPSEIVTAILILIGHYYDSPSQNKFPNTVYDLVAPHREQCL